MANTHRLPLIVGSQYYRAPTPARAEWRRDLELFADKGLNTIKIWAQWRWNNPAPGRYVFDDLAELLAIAHDVGIGVIVNTITDVAPAWVDRTWPDCRMITLDGRQVGPQSNGPRQIGGAPSPCFHHQAAMEASYAFVRECVRALKDAPALLMWDVWNEPELTEAIMREPRLENLVCYCDHSRHAFIGWLRQRYDDSLAALNRAWARNYQHWGEIELPRDPATFRDMIDWRMFFVDTVTQELATRVRLVRQIDPDHPVMTHTVPLPIFNLVTCASDDFALAPHCDLFGNSAGSSPNAADLLASAAGDRLVINAEIHAVGGSTFHQAQPLSDDATDTYLLTQLAHEIKGFVFWQFRPELLGNEAPNWGLTDREGHTTPWLERVAAINVQLQARKELIMAARNRPADVGILLDPENEIFWWCITRDTAFYSHAIQATYDALYTANYRVRFVHPRTLAQNGDLPALYCPAPYWLQDATLAGLEAYVRGGGRLIAEPYLAGWDAATGLHSQRVPGKGWDQIAGVTQGLVLQDRGAGFSAYAIGKAKASSMDDRLTVTWNRVRHQAESYHQLVELRPSTATPYGQVGNGWPALTHHRYGDGVVICLATYLSGAAAGAAHGQGDPGAAALIAALCYTSHADDRPRSKGGKVRVDWLKAPQGSLVIAQSLASAAVEETLHIPSLASATLVDIMTGERFTLRDGSAVVPFRGRQVRAFDVV